MYENGEKIRGHFKKKIHKKKLQKRFLRNQPYGSGTNISYNHYVATEKQKAIDDATRYGYTLEGWLYNKNGNHLPWFKRYWEGNRSFFSGLRKFAKQETNHKLRAEFRNNYKKWVETEEEPNYRKSDYQKKFDYWYTIY